MIAAHCVVHAGPGLVKFEKTFVREPNDDEVLVKAAFTCISPGTELRCLGGHEGADRQFPFVPGYALAGYVSRAGRLSGLEVGQAVVLSGTSEAQGFATRWGGHISHAVQRGEKVIAIPTGVSLLDASMARIAAIAAHGTRIANIAASERVAVVGLGLIGQCSARLCERSGARVVVGDTSPERVAIARAAGVEAVLIEASIVDAFRPTFPNGVDVIIDATGVPSVLPQAVALSRVLPWNDEPIQGTRYVIQGSYADSFIVPYQEAFQRELTFVLPRDRQDRDIRSVLGLLAGRKLHLTDLISHVADPDDAADVYHRLAERGGPWLTAAFDWSRFTE